MTIMIPRGYENEDNFVVFAVDGRSYRLPKGHEVFWPMTNADRIRAMSDEDLAAWIAGMTTVCECCAELNECEAPRGFNRCSHGVEDWLKQPYEGE